MHKKEPEQILVLGKVKRVAKQLRRALIELGRKYECEQCNLKEWQGKELVIEIHHKDGNPLNNIESNLQFLCPNCHSLTPNFYHTKLQKYCPCGNTVCKSAKLCQSCAAKGPRLAARKVTRPSKDELTILIKEKSFVQIGKYYGVSDNAVRKWCKGYSIPLR